MQKLHGRAVGAALAILVLGGCTEDPPTSIDSKSAMAPASTFELADIAGTTGLLADMTDLGTLYAPTDNWWNLDVTNAPLDASTNIIIATIGSYESTGGRLHPDLGKTYGMPYAAVDASTPLVPVTFQYAAESDAGAPGYPAGYPIPAEAATNLRWIEEEGAGNNDHILLIDKGRRLAFELYRASYSNGKWSAGSGAVFKLDSNYRRTDGWTSADAAGLCVTAGLLRYDEVYGSAPIRHALRCSLRQINGFVWPASHRGPSDNAGMPFGMRLRLKQSVNISGYPAPVQKIFQAMKTYGLIVADKGGNMYVQGTMDSRWDNSVLNPAFHALKASDFEVVQRGWKGDGSVPPPPPPPPPPGDPADVELGLLGDMSAIGTVYEPSDNWWNVRVDAAPLDPNSSTIISTIRSYESTGGRMHPDFTPSYGIPYCVVDNNTPLVPVTLRNTSESDKGAPGGPVGYPIPAAAKTNLRYIESGGSLDGDRHLLVYNRDTRMAFELSYAAWDGSKWTAGYGAVFKLDSNYRRPEGWTSTDAAGLCVLAGLVRYDEVYGPNPINHAIRFSIKRTNSYVWPASHEGASDSGAPPLGMRMRLKKSVDISGYPAPVRKIFQAMKDYGIILADRGGNMYVQGTLDSRWDNSMLNPAFHSLNASHFEVIKLGWKPTS